MNEKQLEAFRAVMIGGSTVKAAEMLKISQPAVTRLISALEESTQLLLFTRKKRRLQPTQEAISFYQEVQRSFIGFEKLRKAAEEIRNQNSGHLRIVCLPSFAMGLVPRMLRQFRTFYPNVSTALQVQGTATVIKWISSQQFNVGLVQSAPMIPEVTTERFADIPGVCVLPPGHFLADRSFIQPADLRDLPFISFTLENISRAHVDQAFERENVERSIVMETQYAATICVSVLEGLGVSVVNPLVAHDYERAGLIIRPFRPAAYFQAALIFPVRPAPSPLTTAFVELLREERDRILERYDLHDAGQANETAAIVENTDSF